MFYFIALLVTTIGADNIQTSYKNYKVFRIPIDSEEQLSYLQYFNESGYQYWRYPTQGSHAADLMVAPDKIKPFEEYMKTTQISYTEYIKDVQSLIDKEMSSRGRRCLNMTDLPLDQYHDLGEIYRWLDNLPSRFPGKVELIVAGHSFEGRDIRGVKLSFRPNNSAVVMEGGIHAREWIGPATIITLVEWFLNSNQAATRKVADSYDWYMFPVINPDGYEYTHTNDRLWRKTRSTSGTTNCVGADLNRNWDIHWDYEGDYIFYHPRDPCNDVYRGSEPFSEVEARTFADYLKSVKDKIYFYISLHSYGQYLFFPYTSRREHQRNYNRSYTVGSKAIEAVQRSSENSTHYRLGTSTDVLNLTLGGTSGDWVQDALQVPYSFTFELRPSDAWAQQMTGLIPGFILPANQIGINSEEVLIALTAMLEEASKWNETDISKNE
ncbi:hypothetical protein QAD02_018299 [Eretmocerus hayati]|uniref:Uncharacterized protein n=1 Tax=Eretmocerus hayati TaxID=131215 RepID=A0ACC2PGM6_9HYME|nr:hypothetical protein QAD02_018299 [Eretmocerus hayati]